MAYSEQLSMHAILCVRLRKFIVYPGLCDAIDMEVMVND